jgi:glycosyltransferase involved in cell wall biosynthesis
MTEINSFPLVAVVTPVYNGSPYLTRTLACVQGQTYPNIVHVILDNASTDDTPDVIRRAAGGRVPIVTERNSKTLQQVENWNAAVALTPAAAKYVKILCADDLMRRDCIERLVSVAESDQDISTVTAIDVFDDHIKPHGLPHGQYVFDGRDLGYLCLSGRVAWIPVNHVFFRATPERLRQTFPTDVSFGFDANFFFNLLREGKAGFVDSPLFYTRYHSNNVTSGLVSDGRIIGRELDILQRYGALFIPPNELPSVRKAYFRKITRHLLASRVAGHRGRANIFAESLANFESAPKWLDYVSATLTWPRHLLRKRARFITASAVTPPCKVTEEQFVSGALHFPGTCSNIG